MAFDGFFDTKSIYDALAGIPGNSVSTGTGTAPVTGTFGATGQSAIFPALPGRAIWIKLSGTFVGTVQVERCSDGSTGTATPLTVGGSAWAVFTTPVQEVVSSEDDAGVGYRLNCTAFTSGPITYSIGHK